MTSPSAVFRIHHTGPQMLYQDLGRPGLASLGVSSSGSFDRLSAARANHALGNHPSAPVIEILSGGCELEALSPTSLVITGTDASVAIQRSHGSVIDTATNTIMDVATGDRIFLDHSSYGMRAYLGIRGGFEVQPQLSSCSFDTLSQIGPPPLQPGDILHRGTAIAEEAWWPALRTLPVLWRRVPTEKLKVIPGPREEWFSPEALTLFYSQAYTVSSESNRVGLRLHGENPLRRRRTSEMMSEGMVRGSIQIPPNGQPVVFGPDYPVTGGYPVIAVLTSRACDRSGQLCPGDVVQFVRTS
ncbi:allophanate hydrolase subunit 2 family protein [Corynebacterium poyangense]|uniref:Allophanate hydrolase subunit 2 family protein n=1 Tax=Corynebacterium poyangense TaxID=2684405 RepID=A0A7H0SN28_9CORY|nr:biotin-dependent carboxyltransferase family protein [Corynebacterium poyangense]MBZ8176966.1 allophanate hydrolase subunit 2 family protein [Corynebacterium poyangense]QNQ89953.1 allophanate hydrolase subunit 2 family protein [Corynebacterium poyangense]